MNHFECNLIPLLLYHFFWQNNWSIWKRAATRARPNGTPQRHAPTARPNGPPQPSVRTEFSNFQIAEFSNTAFQRPLSEAETSNFLTFVVLKVTKMKKIPYGISSYETIKTENYYYFDKTKYIEILENYGSRYLFFLRPRRFGKSLFISLLHSYYDIKAKDQFEQLFGDTYIGKNPTPLRNTFPVLRFNFSMVKTFGSIDEITLSFTEYIQTEVECFIEKYYDIF